MKIYQMSEKKKRTYKAVGIFYVLVFAAVLVVKPWHYANPLYDILIYVFVAVVPTGESVHSSVA